MLTRIPDLYVGRVFVPEGQEESFQLLLLHRGLALNLEGKQASFRRGRTGLVEGKNLMVVGTRTPFGRLADILDETGLAVYNTEVLCDMLR